MGRECVVNISWSRLAFVLLCSSALPLKAVTEVKPNEAYIAYAAAVSSSGHAKPSEVLIERFGQEASSSDNIVFDRFTGPASLLAWTRRQSSLGYAGLHRFNLDGAHLFENIATDSLRTAALTALPIDLWEEHWHGWFADLLRGTIGNPEEERIQITSISYSAVRSLWEEADRNPGIHWGLRPWTTNPYLYVLANAGRYDGRSLFTFEGRAGYSILGATKIEGRLPLALPASSRMAGSASSDPARTGHDYPRASLLGVTLERLVRFPGVNSDTVFYLGFRAGANGYSSIPRQENMVVAGLSRMW